MRAKREQEEASSDDETLDFGLVLSDEESAYDGSDLDEEDADDESQAGILSDQDTLEHGVSDEEAAFESGVKILRRHNLPEIEADYHSDSSDQVRSIEALRASMHAPSGPWCLIKNVTGTGEYNWKRPP